MDLNRAISTMRDRIAGIVDESHEIDEVIADHGKSELEKAVYIMLLQSPNHAFDFVVVPGERVFVPDLYSMSAPRVEYELDFALYGGSMRAPLKVAVECDGIRSHGQRHKKRDRRKDVNLQANGWIVVRYSSKEIHEELAKFENPEHRYCELLLGLENLIHERLDIINQGRFSRFHKELAGWKWGDVHCTSCGHRQLGILNKRKHTCKGCGVKYDRIVGASENVWFKGGGYISFHET